MCGHIYIYFPDKLRKIVVGLAILGFEHLGPAYSRQQHNKVHDNAWPEYLSAVVYDLQTLFYQENNLICAVVHTLYTVIHKMSPMCVVWSIN